DRIEPSQGRGLIAPRDPNLRLDRLEAPEETESPERVEQVQVDLVEAHPRKRLPEEGHIEAGVVEGHEELRPRERGREVLQVLPLHERPLPAAVVHAYDREGTAADREAGRLDVEVGDVPPKILPCPPAI